MSFDLPSSNVLLVSAQHLSPWQKLFDQDIRVCSDPGIKAAILMMGGWCFFAFLGVFTQCGIKGGRLRDKYRM